MSLCCDAVCGGGVLEGTIPLSGLLASFQSLPLLPTSKSGPSGADSRVGGFVYLLPSYGPLQRTFLWGWKFLPPPQPWFWGLFPYPGTLGCMIHLTPQLFRLVCQHSCCLAQPVLQPRSSSPSAAELCPFLQVWMNVSPLTPWLSAIHRVRFFVSSGWFLF